MAQKDLHIPSFMTRPNDTALHAESSQPVAMMQASPASQRAANSEPSHLSLPINLPSPTRIHVQTLAQMTKGAPWVLSQMHTRDHHLLIWTTRGTGRINLHGLRRGYGAHHAVFVPAGKVFSFETGLQAQGLTVTIPDDGRVALPDRTRHLKLAEGGAQSELTGILDALRREIHEDRPFLNEAMNAHAQLLSVALRRHLQAEGTTPLVRAAERLARRFCDLLSKDYTSGHSIAWFAEQLEVTPTHLTRVCRECSGMTAAEILNEMVQHRTRLLLTTTDIPMNRIALSMGFNSPAYFTRFCQQHFNDAPTQIRKLALEAKLPT